MKPSRSSIFNFDTLVPGALRFPKAALLALVIVGGAEATLHMLADRLPEPVLWGAGEASSKIAQAEALGPANPQGIDVLILGPSHASVGISPEVLIEACGKAGMTAYNGGINGRDYPVVEFVFEHVYEPQLQPRTVVITANPICFNRNAPLLAHNNQEFFDAPAPRALISSGIEGWWRGVLAHDFALFYYRTRARGLSEGCVGGKQVLDPFGYHAVSGTFDEKRKAELRSPGHPYAKVWKNYAFGGASAEAFEKLITDAQSAGAKVLVVNMPFRPELLALDATAEKSYAAYLEAIRALRERLAFDWLDLEETLPLTDGDFRDVDHLNETGAAKATRAIAQYLCNTASASE